MGRFFQKMFISLFLYFLTCCLNNIEAFSQVRFNLGSSLESSIQCRDQIHRMNQKTITISNKGDSIQWSALGAISPCLRVFQSHLDSQFSDLAPFFMPSLQPCVPKCEYATNHSGKSATNGSRYNRNCGSMQLHDFILVMIAFMGGYLFVSVAMIFVFWWIFERKYLF